MKRARVGLGLLVVLLGLLLWRFATTGEPAASSGPASAVFAGVPEAGPDAGHGIGHRAGPGSVVPSAPPNEPVPLLVPAADLPERRTFPVKVTVTRFESPRSVPAAGARIEFGVSPFSAPRGEPLITLEADTSGEVHAELPYEALAALGDVRIRFVWARSAGDGLLTRTAKRPVPSPRHDGDPPKPLELQLAFVPGVVVEGRVVDGHGAPVAASVSLAHDTGAPLLGQHVDRTDAEGRFHLEVAAEGPATVRARARSGRPVRAGDFPADGYDLGTGTSDTFDVRFDAPPPFVEVVVSGPGALRGTVRDDQGGPAPGLELLLLVAELDDGSGGPHLPQPRTEQLDREGRGHVWVTTETDAEGAFEVLGLRADLYVVRARVDDGDPRGGHPLRLTPAPVPSQGQHLDLRLTRPYLALRVRRADGGPPDDEIVAADGWARWELMRAWPSDPMVMVTLAPGHTHRQRVSDPHLAVRRIAPGEFVVEVPDACAVDVALRGGGRPWISRRLEVPSGAGRIEVDLVLPEPHPLGTLALSVTAPDGRPIHDHVRVRLVHPGSGAVLIEHVVGQGDEWDWPLRLELPAASYLALVEDHPAVESTHFEVVQARQYGGFEAPVTIVAHRETPVHAMLSAGARLEVQISGEVDAADRAATPRVEGTGLEGLQEDMARFVSLSLERPGRWAEPVEFTRSSIGGDGSAHATDLSVGLPLGGSGTSEALMPGVYELVARTRGGRELRRPVQLIAGQTLAVTLAFE